MSPVLRLLSRILQFLPVIFTFLRDRQLRKDAKTAAEADIIVQNAQRERKAAEIVAERRSTDDAVSRLRDGQF